MRAGSQEHAAPEPLISSVIVADVPLAGLSFAENDNLMNAPNQILFDKINQLPPQRLAELEDFVDFLCTCNDDHRLALAAAKASEASFSEVWNNEDDAAYDRM